MINASSAFRRLSSLYFIGLLSVAFFYYFPSAIDSISGLPREAIGEARRQGMSTAYEITASLVLISLLTLGLMHSLSTSIKDSWNSLSFLAAVGFSLFLLGGISQPSKLFAVFLVFMLITVCAPNWTIHRNTITVIANVLLLIIAISLLLSIYEIISNTAWAGYKSSAGVAIRRPSALFFNPNVFGFWLALIGAFFAMLYFNCYERRTVATGLVLCSLGALFASSRGYCYLLILAVSAVATFHHSQRKLALRCVLFVVLPLLIGALTLIAFESLMPSPLLETFAGLAWRLLMTPQEILTHVFGSIHTNSVTVEFKRSFAGRFEGRALDSGIGDLFFNLSGLSLIGLILFHLSCFLRVWKQQKARVLPFLMMTFFFIFSGLFMSYAVFPLWLSWAVIVAMFQYVQFEEKAASK